MDKYSKEVLEDLVYILKTPLFSVQSYLLTLKEGAIDNMVGRDKYIDRAINGTERLVHIVEDLDTITKLETGKKGLNKEKMVVVDLTQSVFDMLEEVAEVKNISIISLP